LRSTIPAERVRERHETAPNAKKLLHMVERYFCGQRIDFAEVEVAADDDTPFQRAVADALRAVPWGEVVSYAELARAAGYPNAQRAAGTFCAHNRFPLVVPCHRVVGADGIGGYGSLGVAYKRRLLELEGVVL
jgi:methylated-DNA-[protein]-cysteine S-methyltransferase